MRRQQEGVVERAGGKGAAGACQKQRPGSFPPAAQSRGRPVASGRRRTPGRREPAAGSDDISAPTFLTKLAFPQGKRALKTRGFFFPPLPPASGKIADELRTQSAGQCRDQRRPPGSTGTGKVTSNSSATFQLRQTQQEATASPNSVFHIPKGQEWGFGFIVPTGWILQALPGDQEDLAKSQVPGVVAHSHLQDSGSLGVANSSCQ